MKKHATTTGGITISKMLKLNHPIYQTIKLDNANVMHLPTLVGYAEIYENAGDNVWITCVVLSLNSAPEILVLPGLNATSYCGTQCWLQLASGGPVVVSGLTWAIMGLARCVLRSH
jgi:hypothetical protein